LIVAYIHQVMNKRVKIILIVIVAAVVGIGIVISLLALPVTVCPGYSNSDTSFTLDSPNLFIRAARGGCDVLFALDLVIYLFLATIFNWNYPG